MFQRTLRQTTWSTYSSTIEMCIKPPLSYSSITGKKIELENSLLLTCKIRAPLVNTLAADEKYLALHRENLTKPIQMQLSKKQKTISEFFRAFLKSILNFKYFGSNDIRHCFCISEITDSENVLR